ncbi:MAG: class I SAM-dependent methyltransferase [Halofilum sp. (in: g-proteobacteria)]|nr:class I SAM-dependent methyltransferase [Halofilum sp. (in: g-proteobacteria)]
MRSARGERSNHDDEAAGHDADVADERQAIRAGYAALLAWVTRTAAIAPGHRVLELGSGRGDLTRRLRRCRELVCVDRSREMEAVASARLGECPWRRFVCDDILGVFERGLGTFDAVVSAYAVHHLRDTEKAELFREIRRVLRPGGRAVFGDLMLAPGTSRAEAVAAFSARGDDATANAIAGEYFWSLDETPRMLEALGFQVSLERFSELSHGVLARQLGVAR